ncbi:AraC family transcriptional regulator [Aureispira sp. CCB-E]|uniref:AraC family transcriptional regulator n=1 Tax=Aureispira sp. CCB-E TaxID=3051121 RepID=UPI0028689D9E|nr:AraC family transcriptional regulator [Aureispira sp. CCB-E]WMX12185.1 AraC family transcriptional regulator [Aureispira sp. CCB-E]
MAKRFYTRYALNIFTLELDAWKFPMHTHNFYELIFIKKGKGKQSMNGVLFPYKEGDIFFLSPKDEHLFEIVEKTTFEFIQFTEQLFLEQVNKEEKGIWEKTIEQVLYSPNVIPQDIICIENDRVKLFQLLALLKEEYATKRMYTYQILRGIFQSMMLIIVRNLHVKNPSSEQAVFKEEEKINKILSHIRQHIMEKEKISLKAIADKFFISENYISIFIKKHTQFSIKQLIIETRLKTAESLLQQSSYTISEIAEQLGFTDAAHFSNTFKKHKGCRPSAFRKKN